MKEKKALTNQKIKENSRENQQLSLLMRAIKEGFYFHYSMNLTFEVKRRVY